MTRRAVALSPILLALAACGPGENDPGPGGVTMEEARQLDEAASRLDAQELPPGTLDNPPGDGAPPPDPAPTD